MQSATRLVISKRKRVTLSPVKPIMSNPVPTSSSSEEEEFALDGPDSSDYEDCLCGKNCDPKNCGLETSVLVNVTDDSDNSESEEDDEKESVASSSESDDDDKPIEAITFKSRSSNEGKNHDSNFEEDYDLDADIDIIEPIIMPYINQGVELVQDIFESPFVSSEDNEETVNEQIIEGPHSLLMTLGLLKKLNDNPHAVVTTLDFTVISGPQWLQRNTRKDCNHLVYALGSLVRRFCLVKLALFFHSPPSQNKLEYYSETDFAGYFFQGYLHSSKEPHNTIPEFVLRIRNDTDTCIAYNFRKFLKKAKVLDLTIKGAAGWEHARDPETIDLISNLLGVKVHVRSLLNLRSLSLFNIVVTKPTGETLIKILSTCPIESFTLENCHSPTFTKSGYHRTNDWYQLFSSGCAASKSLKRLEIKGLYVTDMTSVFAHNNARDFLNEIIDMFKINRGIESFSLTDTDVRFDEGQWMSLFKTLKRYRSLKEPVNTSRNRHPPPECFVDEASSYMRK
jgi:hypothetical protein